MIKKYRKKSLQEMRTLREHLYKSYFENEGVTREVLLISRKLDQNINKFMKFYQQEMIK